MSDEYGCRCPPDRCIAEEQNDIGQTSAYKCPGIRRATLPDEPDAVQIQMDIQSAVDEAVRNIREHALRQVMEMANVMRSWECRIGDSHDLPDGYDVGFTMFRRLILDKIEAMIAKDAATQHGQ